MNNCEIRSSAKFHRNVWPVVQYNSIHGYLKGLQLSPLDFFSVIIWFKILGTKYFKDRNLKKKEKHTGHVSL